MSEEKTLGQILYEAEVASGEHGQWSDYYQSLKGITERRAAGIAAVARHVIDERLAPYETALRAMAIPAVVEAAKQSMASEQHKIGPNAWASRPWEVSEKPGESPQPEAGDWAMLEAVDIVAEFRCIDALTSAARIDTKLIAQRIREAAERHYAKQINMLKAVIGAGKEAEAKVRQERDGWEVAAASAHKAYAATNERAESAEAECGRLKEQIGNCVLDGKSLRSCLQTLSLLHTDRRLVEMVGEMFSPSHDPPAEKHRGDNMAKRAEAAEAALEELVKAVNKHAKSLEAMRVSGSSTLYRVPRHEWRVSPTDAILAADRTNKAAIVAEEVVVK